MKRRSLLGLFLAAPAIVRAESLMPLYVPRIVLVGDGIHDDTAALQALIGRGGLIRLPRGTFRFTRTLLFPQSFDLRGHPEGSIFRGDGCVGLLVAGIRGLA